MSCTEILTQKKIGIEDIKATTAKTAESHLKRDNKKIIKSFSNCIGISAIILLLII